MKICDIAFVAHEVNRAYCASIGDNSQKPWADAPEWQKRSAEEGVLAVLSGKVTSPGDSHVSWLTHKLKEGWKYGEVKDETAKTHPCMVPFDALPFPQQVKDHLFLNTVKTLLVLHGHFKARE